MGEVLVVTTMPEEQLTRGLWDQTPDGREVRLAALYGGTPDGRGTSLPWREIRARHPAAYYRVRVAQDALWTLPPEPERGGRDWTPEEAEAHAEVVRASLQAFLDRQLERLGGTMRSGWWILEKVRVEVVPRQ